MYKETTALRKIASLNKRIRAIPGGTSASKTISVLLYLIARAQTDTHPTLTSIVSESFPHLKRGAIRDFLSIMQEHRYFDDKLWNKTDYTYTFETGSKIEFFSVDQPGKVRGPRRDRLFINEANNIPYETFDQLEVRTKEFIILDWNPTAEFWYYSIDNKAGVRDRDDVDEITLTYKDNEALSPEIVAAIEKRKGNKGWWKVYGEGQLGELEGLIYKGWQEIDEIPDEAKLVRRWLDYGYSNDPTAIGDIYKWNDSYILDEQLYQKGLLNDQIAEFILNLPQVPVAADSAEPKSNDELTLRGITIIPSKKGQGSVNAGIQLVQQQKVFYTSRSINIRKERQNYIWLVDDKTNKKLNEPAPNWNHHMDGIRYGFETLMDFVPPEVAIKQMAQFEANTHRQMLNNTR